MRGKRVLAILISGKRVIISWIFQKDCRVLRFPQTMLSVKTKPILSLPVALFPKEIIYVIYSHQLKATRGLTNYMALIMNCILPSWPEQKKFFWMDNY